MSNRTITYGTPVKLIITPTDLASRNGKTFSDITNVVYFLKKERRDADADAVFSANVSPDASITLNSGTSTIELNILDTSYGKGKIEKGIEYLECIGVEFNGSGIFIEDYDPRASNKIMFSHDKIRQ